MKSLAKLPAALRPVFVDGTRIPFAASGTTYTNHSASPPRPSPFV
jgi:hypothetical protein